MNEELTKSWLANNHLDIELELAKKFHLVEEKTKSDGTKITCLSSSIRTEHFRDPNLNLWKSTDDLWRIVDSILMSTGIFQVWMKKSITPMRILRERCSCTQI